MFNFPVSDDKSQGLKKRMDLLKILESDLEEQFIRASGPGGQKVNKTASCVLLTHLPSKIQVKCQQTRNQSLNRFFARRLLCDKIEEKVLKTKSAEQQKREKIRRQKRKRSKRSKEKMLSAKHHRGELKKMRSGSLED